MKLDEAKKLVFENPKTYKKLSPLLRKDKDLIKIAIKKWGNALEYAADEIKSDKNIVLLAIKRGGEAIKFSDKSLVRNLVNRSLNLSPKSSFACLITPRLVFASSWASMIFPYLAASASPTLSFRSAIAAAYFSREFEMPMPSYSAPLINSECIPAPVITSF